jgi:hypothetical protein
MMFYRMIKVYARWENSCARDKVATRTYVELGAAGSLVRGETDGMYGGRKVVRLEVGVRGISREDGCSRKQKTTMVGCETMN